jgi:hypothetical protein
MIAVDTEADTSARRATNKEAAADEADAVVVVLEEKVGSVEEVVELVETEAWTMADARLNGMATTNMAFAMVMKLRPYTLNDASRISPTERGRSIGTPPGIAPIV